MSKNKELKELLVEIDAMLSRVNVRGDDIFAMADSRRLLKTVYDMVTVEQPNIPNGKEDSVNGG